MGINLYGTTYLANLISNPHSFAYVASTFTLLNAELRAAQKSREVEHFDGILCK